MSIEKSGGVAKGNILENARWQNPAILRPGSFIWDFDYNKDIQRLFNTLKRIKNGRFLEFETL